MLRRAYDRAMELAAIATARAALAGVSFIESSVFPIPPDVMLVPMALAKPEKRGFMPGFAPSPPCSAGSSAISSAPSSSTSIGKWPILRFTAMATCLRGFPRGLCRIWRLDRVFAGFTPFPFKIITIASGLTPARLSWSSCWQASPRERLRFFVVAGLLYWFGRADQGLHRALSRLLFTIGSSCCCSAAS